MKTVIVTDGLQEIGIEALRREGLSVEVVPTLTEPDLCVAIANADGLIVRSATKVTAKVIEAGRQLQVVGRAGAGVDNIDVEAASERGIIVMNTPGANTIAVAEHTIGLLLALARKLPQAHGALKGGRWEKERFAGVELFNKVLGIIGLGRIGSEVARRALGLRMQVIAYDPYLTAEAAQRMGVEVVELDQLLARADFISVHVPLTPETRNFLGAGEFARMKDGVRIINCARGGVLSEEALVKAVRDGKVAGAALDVFEKEPLPPDHPLLGLDQVIVTPHLAASTEEAQSGVALAIAQQIADVLVRGIVRNAVNVPSVDAETLKELRPYLTLAEKMGRFLAQLAEGRMKQVRLEYAGEVAGLATSVLTVTFLKGLLDVILEEKVSDVNAPYLAKARGIKVVETSTAESEDYASLLAAELQTNKGSWRVAGTLFHKREPRIVRIDGFPLEAVPAGWMLVFANLDVPGVIGRIGTLCGRHQINIAGMQLGRERRGGQAVSILNLDDPIPEAILREIRAMPDIVFAKLVKL
ncbi:MAG: phosphoglycerate dehydrogenase [Candidatus Rokubacteria bacterium]|nr:phosphoglycerate dehydrogenase [Candidatus Rokubacteria bacterium]